MSLDRRSFVAGSAAFLAAPALGLSRSLAQSGATVDAVVVGGGAAGIAAARRLAAGGARYALLEAAGHVGGRCVTDTQTFGVPYDRGARWIRRPDGNPLVKLASSTGLDIYPAPRGHKIRLGPRYARAGELENYFSALVRAQRAIAQAGRAKSDTPAAAALPDDLGVWRETIEFALGPYVCGKDLAEVSATDYARGGERDIAAFCRQGYGTLLARLADGLSVRLSTPVAEIDWRRGIAVKAGDDTLRTRTVIVTVSTGVLASDAIKFDPPLPKAQANAVAVLEPGSYERIALELPENPLGLQPDELVFEQVEGTETAAVLANVSDTDICFVDVAGAFGRDLAAQGQAAMIAFARGWLSKLYGSSINNAIERSHVTRWSHNPWTRGAVSVAKPGGAYARAALMKPMRGRVWFAGEAIHLTRWGTVGGAWESGERAAEEALKAMGMLDDPDEPKRTPRRRRRRRR